jgi:energy-coupling factor transporter ATP-binding protein EcfA2
MYIVSLELFKYRRLALNNIEYIKLTPENKIQLILGTNGSGKSSLIKELSPLPAIPQEYSKGGYKTIVLIHKNVQYILKSTIGEIGNEFSFIRDNEELNPGKTVTVYKELVKKYFNITQEVHDLAIGQLNFHEMTVNERRNWFTKISGVDYTFALSYYNKVREKYRDTQGNIRMLQARLVQESEKVLTEADILQLQTEIDEIKTDINTLIENKDNAARSVYQIQNDLEANKDELLTLADSIIKDVSLLNQEYHSRFQYENISETIRDISSSIAVKQNLIEITNQDIAERLEKKELLDKNSVQSIIDIDNQLSNKLIELDSLLQQRYYSHKLEDPKATLLALTSIEQLLIDTVSVMETNEDLRYSRDNYRNKSDRLVKVKLEIEQYSTHITNTKAGIVEMEHLKEHSLTECPSCSHKWFANYDERKYLTLLSNRDILIKKLDDLEKARDELEDYLQKTSVYFTAYRQYSHLLGPFTILETLRDILEINEVILKTPSQISRYVHQYKSDIEILIKIDQTQSNIDELLKLKEMISKQTTGDNDNLINSISSLETKLINLRRSVDKDNDILIHLKNKENYIRLLDGYINDIEKYVKTEESSYLEILRSKKRDIISIAISDLNTSLAKKESLMAKVNSQKTIVSDIEKQLEILLEQVDVYKAIVKELSPNEGLIAKSLTNFINHFINQLNSFIKKVWSYPMELVFIESSESEGVDLDFKFSVKVNEHIIISDVSKCSQAMKEVIDLAFRIVSMVCLHLDDGPIYCDELGANMDAKHRAETFNLITNLLVSTNFSQVFMISHYSDSYGCLKNADVTVLCPTNIVVPKDMGYNKNCEIK